MERENISARSAIFPGTAGRQRGGGVRSTARPWCSGSRPLSPHSPRDTPCDTRRRHTSAPCQDTAAASRAAGVRGGSGAGRGLRWGRRNGGRAEEGYAGCEVVVVAVVAVVAVVVRFWSGEPACGLRGPSEEQARRDRWKQRHAGRPKVSAGAERDVGEMGAVDPGARTKATRVCAPLVTALCGAPGRWTAPGG